MATSVERSEAAIAVGADWLAATARITSPDDQYDDPCSYPTPGYLGAVRTEYDTKTGRWSLNGPVWHTGQAIRAVLLAYRRSGDPDLLDAALQMGNYLTHNLIQLAGEPNDGLLLAYEGDNVTVNNQVLIETLAGWLDLAEVTGEREWADRARLVTDFMLEHCYLPDEGLVVDHFHVGESRPYPDPDNPLPGRIILDDAILHQLAEATGDGRYTEVFLTMAQRALQEENPQGNWTVFPPWHHGTRRIHIRTAWWWGYPLFTAYDLTGDGRFLETGQRVGQWFLDHQTLDGGFYYSPLTDGRHTSFGLAVSGSAVATLVWHELFQRTGDERYRDAIRRSVRFLLTAQFSADCDDPNIRGALWETLNVPDGSACPGFLIRDVATIFMIRAFDRLLTAGDVLDGDLAELDNTMPW